MNLNWIARTKNSKTGDIPSSFIGDTIKETKKSCQGCPQFNRGDGKTNCYSYGGLTHLGVVRSQFALKKKKNKKKYNLKNALKNRAKTAKATRFGILGDPSQIGLKKYKAAVKQIRKEGLAVLSYTHHWRRLKDSFWSKNIMASCDSIEQVDEAAKKSWRAAVILPASFTGKRIKSPGGEDIIVCPAIWTKKLGLSEDKVTTCNTCRLCDASRKGPHIGFPAHGPAFRYVGKKLPLAKI